MYFRRKQTCILRALLTRSSLWPVIRGVAGKDATKTFDKHHRRGILEPYKPKYQIGVLDSTSSSAASASQAEGGVSKMRGGLLSKLWN